MASRREWARDNQAFRTALRLQDLLRHHDLAVAQDAAPEGVSAAGHVIAVVDADADSSADPDAAWE